MHHTDTHFYFFDVHATIVEPKPYVFVMRVVRWSWRQQGKCFGECEVGTQVVAVRQFIFGGSSSPHLKCCNADC